VVVNSHDVVQDSFTTTTNLIMSSVSYTLPSTANVTGLTFTGTTAVLGVGGSQNSVLTANSAADTLEAGAGLATLYGGTGNDIFQINNTGDVVIVTATGVTDTIQSTVSYVLPPNVTRLTLSGSNPISATGNNLTDTLTAGSGNDTLYAGTGNASMVGGAGNDLFVVNSTGDTVNAASHGIDTVQSSVNFSLPTTIANLVLTGTASLSGASSTLTGGTLTANSGADTLTALGASTTLYGGAGNDVFSINNTLDVISDTYTATTNTLNTSVSYTLPTFISTLNVTGTTAVLEVGNGGNDSITANTASDTLVGIGSGSDTLVAGTTGTDSLVGGTGTDVFVVKNTADIVTVASATTASANDTIQSSVNYSLPTNVEYLTFTGTAAVTGTGNGLTDLIVGNTGADTLNGGTGIAVLEGGSGTGAHGTIIKATGNQAALIGGSAGSTLTGGAFKDFYAAGIGPDTITTGATANVVAYNKGDGAVTIGGASASDVLSLGAGIDTENLTFTKSGTNLVLNDGVSGDSITLASWFSATTDQNVKTLQVVEIASTSYNPSGTDGLRNQALEEFNFSSLVAAYTLAGSTSSWTLATAMSSAKLASSATAAYGGDLAYYYGLNGNLTGMNLSAAQSTLTNSSYATAAQTIDSWSSISGGSGIHLLEEQRSTYVDPMQMAWMSADAGAHESTPLLGGELDAAGLPTDALSTLVATGGAAPIDRRVIDTPRVHTL
jgi:Ca2+-binding RTX toxin-like protein